MKILVTGFEPFGKWQRNPSGEVAHHLDGSTIVDAEITGLVLPVSYKRAAAPLLVAIDELQPDVVLNLGQGSAVGVRVERSAVNRCTAPEGGDNDGYEPQGEPIINDGPETYASTLPVTEIVDLLSNVKFNAASSDLLVNFSVLLCIPRCIRSPRTNFPSVLGSSMPHPYVRKFPISPMAKECA